MVIWDYDVPAAAKSVGWAVVVNNVEALEILLDCGYPLAALLAGTGALVRVGAGWEVLRAVGLKEGSRLAGLVELRDAAAELVPWLRGVAGEALGFLGR